jgi:hypothetical protein
VRAARLQPGGPSLRAQDLADEQARTPGQRAWTRDQLGLLQAELKAAAARTQGNAGKGRRPRVAVGRRDARGCDHKPDPSSAETQRP